MQIEHFFTTNYYNNQNMNTNKNLRKCIGECTVIIKK